MVKTKLNVDSTQENKSFFNLEVNRQTFNQTFNHLLELGKMSPASSQLDINLQSHIISLNMSHSIYQVSTG